MILNFNRKKRHGMTLKIKGTKVICLLKFKDKHPFGIGSGKNTGAVFTMQAHPIWLQISLSHGEKWLAFLRENLV